MSTGLAILISVCLTNCKLVKDEFSGSTLSMEDFRITNEIQGWTQTEGGYDYFASLDELTRVINGGSEYYKDFGMREGIAQVMQSGEKTYDALIMDFGTESKAQAIFEDQKFKITKTLKISDYSVDNVIGNEDALGGTAIAAYAFFNQYYIEIRSIEGADRRQHLLDADLFLGYYKKKVGDRICVE